MDERALEELEDLHEQDVSLSEAVDALRVRQASIAALRRRVETARLFLQAYPREAEARRRAVEDASSEIARRREAAATAAQALEGHHDDGTFDRLQRAATRATERLVAAEARLERAVGELEELEGDASELPAELERLRIEARRYGGDPPSDAEGLIEWASRMHAELFVMAGHLDRQRDQVIREANELASMLLGEPTYGSTVAQALARVEQR